MVLPSFVNLTAFVLVVIGALNWGLFGLTGLDLVAFLFGAQTTLAKIVYGLVGLSGILITAKKLTDKPVVI